MESRKRLYKTTRNAPTLTERVKQDRSKRINTRKDAFNANRRIELDDSISTPHKPAPIKISQIKDKPEKLRAFIELKRTANFKKAIESRSPFIPYVPSGRWVPKKEEPSRPQRVIITTPVRKALLGNEKILKKATLKQLATTAKKETAAKNNTAPKKAIEVKPAATVKSRKKILCEVNSDTAVNLLNNTFEVLPDIDDNVRPDLFMFASENSPPDADLQKLKEEMKLKSVVKVQKKKVPAIRATSRPVLVKKETLPVQKTVKKAIVAKIVKLVKKPVIAKVVKPVERPQTVPIASSPIAPPSTKPEKVAEKSSVYKYHKANYDIQIQYLIMRLKGVEADKNAYINLLSEDDQSKIHQIIQHGNKIINDKMKNFLEFLEDFEAADANDVKRCTKDDVENYFDLIYEEIEKFKEDLIEVEELKNVGLKEAAAKKKRRSTRVASDATPRRSRRIADHQDSPLNHACFGCTPMSASKVNTPRSTKKRRTLFKNKELNFD